MTRVPKKSRASSVLKWGGDVLILGGLATLIWCGVVVWQAHRFQTNAARYLAKGGQAAYSTAQLGGLIGWMDIPSVNVSVPLLNGDSAASLRLGAGHIPGTALPGEAGNIGIAGHRDTCFRALRNVHRGATIMLITPAGSHEYVVDFTKIVAPSDVRVLEGSAGRFLTLVTCYPFYYVGPAPRRFVVRAHEIHELQPQDVS